MIENRDHNSQEIVDYYKDLVGKKIQARMRIVEFDQQAAAEKLFSERLFDSIAHAQAYIANIQQGNLERNVLGTHHLFSSRLEQFLALLHVAHNDPLRKQMYFLDRLILEYSAKKYSELGTVNPLEKLSA